jgi:hypothetical protein
LDAAADAAADPTTLLREKMGSYPHMCRDGHQEIGHNDSRDDELCPLCRERARSERLRLELEKIGFMDEFLDAEGAKAMMNIARDAIEEDEK